ncbi:carboxypeptidase-like regulatory domain-containing protein [Cohnella panacarvi]|uniref:carboxypeptidase-like regulatory domain-containing protein n=1 Tax=Cohnella panacarvi TaxID=400776 RepID=UPI00047DB1A0|nr:carboxypeptidase-like regulatory domain-containing protein [Cohnella panacarvi]
MIRMSKAGLYILLTFVTALWTDSRWIAHANKDVLQARIELEQTTFVVKTWRGDGSHLAADRGRLTLGGRPVANALVQVDSKGRTIRTGEDGAFAFDVDRSLIAYKPVKITSVHEATMDGKPIGKDQAAAIMTAAAAISVYHPIELIKVKPSDEDANKVKVHARIRSEPGDIISFFQADKYRISGRVGDHDGNPVKDAIVWIDRDRGESFAKSTPTDKDGNYEMYYWPEDEETNLTVIVGTRRYTLPDGKVIKLPRNTSVDIRIRLPREGTVIDDKSPMLVCTTAKGASYTGLLAGLDVPPGTSYALTIPDRQGRFVLTVPKDAWDKRPRFFETRLTAFVGLDKILKAGDELPSDYLHPSDKDPRVDVIRPATAP